MFSQANVTVGNPTEYAVGADFCRIFAQDMSGLYVLSLLLTAHPEKAEQCFAAALDECLGATRVFKEWGPSWARRAVIQNAVRMMQPRLERRLIPAGTLDTDRRVVPADGFPLPAVLELPTFDRFVFVMSVLERGSDHDCAVLLGCSRADLVRARVRTVERIAAYDEKRVQDSAFGTGRFFVPAPLAAKTA